MTTPDIACPFEEEGFSAYVNDWCREDCPYEEGTDGQAGWLKGYDHAYTDHMKQ
jgi:hypothetical protein